DISLKCGNSYVNSLYARTSGASTPLPAPAGFTQLGCYMDQSARTLTLSSTTDSSGMTVEKCIAFCPATATYIGLASGTECYCGTTLSVNAKVAATDCVSSCVGNPAQICGGNWRLTLFQRNGASSSSSFSSTSTTTFRSASDALVPSGWANLGCYVDQPARTLTGASRLIWSDVTPALCAANCAGYTYFGTENGNECFCGNALTSNVPTAISECNVDCGGDASQKCGGGWRLTLYQSTWTNQGCYVDQPARTLNGASKTDNSMTIGMCQTFCGGSGFTYAGVENRLECYCGNTLTVNSPAPSTDCQAP
ncbi:hypothetical protein FRC00_011351, partial [Tulasnella sp. 408]